MGRFAEFLLAFRWLMIAVVFAALSAAAWVMPEIEFSPSITPLIEGQEEARQRTDSLEAELPPQKYHLVAMVTWPKAIGHAELAALDRLHDAIAVDDTIHLLTRYVQERKRDPGAATRSALLTSLRTSGAALAVTSIILVAGSLCFLPANFQSIHDVGILLSAIVVTALIADLFVLPLMIERFGGR
jgi:predicted RND superfamily exporter protein